MLLKNAIKNLINFLWWLGFSICVLLLHSAELCQAINSHLLLRDLKLSAEVNAHVSDHVHVDDIVQHEEGRVADQMWHLALLIHGHAREAERWLGHWRCVRDVVV